METPCRYLHGHGARGVAAGGVVDGEVADGVLTRFGKLFTCRRLYSPSSTTDGYCIRAARRIGNYRQGASVNSFRCGMKSNRHTSASPWLDGPCPAFTETKGHGDPRYNERSCARIGDLKGPLGLGFHFFISVSKIAAYGDGAG